MFDYIETGHLRVHKRENITPTVTNRHYELGFSYPEWRVEDTMLAEVEAHFPASPGKRFLGSDPTISKLSVLPHLLKVARDILQEELIPVRAIFFVKSHENNWLVPWHQDITLAVPSRFEADGYQHWSRKDGIWHVQPPSALLGKMVALRLHIDSCNEEDGPLKVIPQTHKFGKLSSEQINELVTSRKSQVLLAERGEILAMCPLLLHSSSKATGVSRRRVLHLECCAESAYTSQLRS